MEQIYERINKLTTLDSDIINMLLKSYDNLKELESASLESLKAKDVMNFKNKKEQLIRLVASFEKEADNNIINSVTELRNYLLMLGYNVAERTLYEHKKAGKLPFTGDNIFLKNEVDDYAFKFLKKSEYENLSYVEKKAKAEAEYKEIKIEKEKLLIDEAVGRLIDRDTVGREFAGRIELIKRLMDEIVVSLPSLLINQDEKVIRDILKEKLNYILLQYSSELECLK